jgi:hypothetical protein
MSNVLHFDRHPTPTPGGGPADDMESSPHPAADDDPQARCIRAAGALAMACADWSMALLHRPCPGGVELLIEAKVLVRDLLLLADVRSTLHDCRPAPTTLDLTTRIRRLKEKAHALGILLQAPRP